MVIGALAYTMVLGLPSIAWGGIIALVMILLTFAIGYLNQRGIRIIPFKYHKPVAVLAVIACVLHGAVGLMSMMGL